MVTLFTAYIVHHRQWELPHIRHRNHLTLFIHVSKNAKESLSNHLLMDQVIKDNCHRYCFKTKSYEI